MEQKNNMATASLVMGILSLIMSCCCFLGLMLGGVAIVFALLSRTDHGFEGNARAGLITGIVGMVLSAISMILLIGFFSLAAAEGLSSGIYGWLPGIGELIKGGYL